MNPDASFRPPAVPLVVCDPNFSTWSMTDQLTDALSCHWTGANRRMYGLIRIDSTCYRFMGKERKSDMPAVKQIGVEVLPTRTIYIFEQDGIELSLTFTTPLLPHDLDLLSRPATYLTLDVHASDGGSHDVSLYVDIDGTWAVDVPAQQVVWSRHQLDDLHVLSIGSRDQQVLEKAGDDLRIDWGYLYLALPPGDGTMTVGADASVAASTFAEAGTLPANDDMQMPRAANDRFPALACAMSLGQVGQDGATRYLALAYDDQFSVEYFHRKLRPYWRRTHHDAGDLLRAVIADYSHVVDTCRAYDDALMRDLAEAGGDHYARLAALAFRQCIAAHKLVMDADGSPLFFSKENFSNGCMGTVDVTYPSSPFFLLFNHELLKAQLKPILDYAASPRWKFPFAPHDIGRYPLANGQVYGGGEQTLVNQMPVEECGNMLLMMAGVAKVEQSADFALEHWETLSGWAEYLREKGLDPEHQLCTDDFAGHLAHNVNLSLKAILAIGAFGMLCGMAGREDEEKEYRGVAGTMASQWLAMADDGDHTRLTFDRPGTWSQKYNLIWDGLLGLDLFPPELARREIAFYLTKQGRFGLPLDSRKAYTKLDWTVWSATMAERPDDFTALIEPLYRWANETPTRVPLTDWFWTTDGKKAGFQARSVVGGIYVKLLADAAIRDKWSGRAAQHRTTATAGS